MKKLMRILGGVGVSTALMAVLFSSTVVSAAEFIAPDDSGNVIVAANETHNNLYVAGGSVLVNSPVEGDLVVAGGNVTVEGDVSGDLMIAGGSVYVNGAIGGDVRAAGGDVIINNTVGGDVVAVGGSLKLTDKAVVSGDVQIAGGDVNIAGPITGKLGVYGGKVTLNSAVTGETTINASEKLMIGSAAVLPENASYKSWQEAEIAEGAQTGGLTYEQTERKNNHAGRAFAGIWTVGFVIKLLAMIVTALILLKLFPKKASLLITKYVDNVWSNLGIGFIGIIAVPLTAIILLITFVGYYAGLILLFLWVVWMLVSVLLGMAAVGAWINQKLLKKEGLIVDWQAIVIGVVVMALAALVPVIGWLVMLLVIFAGFGTIIRYIAEIIRHQQAEPTSSIE